VGYAGEKSDITNCEVAGKVEGFTSLGLLIGTNHGGTIARCNASGEVNAAASAGGLAGNNHDGGSIDECTASVKVKGGDRVGGLVGWNWGGGEISKSEAYGNVIAMGVVAGGLVGSNEGVISECQASGFVFGKGMVGGLVGKHESWHGWRTSEIKNCRAVGGVTAKLGCAGGLVGVSEAEIRHCYAVGKVKCAQDQFAAGGLVSKSSGQIWDAYWDKESTTQENSDDTTIPFGSKGKTTEEMKKRVTIIGWDLDSIWQIDEGKRYPILRCFPDSPKEAKAVQQPSSRQVQEGEVEFPTGLLGRVAMVIINYEGDVNIELERTVVSRLMPLALSGCGFKTYCDVTVPLPVDGDPVCGIIRTESDRPKAGLSLDTYMSYIASKGSFPPGVPQEYSPSQIGYWVGNEQGRKVHAVLLVG
jgi:hypothetical protein